MIHSQRIYLDSERCDQYETLRADSLFLLMQNIAGEHANLLGCGRENLRQHNTAWVLARLSLRMQRWPKWNDTLTITTAPGVGRAGLYRRYYEFADQIGPLGYAASLWSVIDLDKRAIAASDKAPIVPAADYSPPLPSPAKVRPCVGQEKIVSYQCQYTDADLNQHINNAAYIRFLENCLPSQQFEHQFLSELDVCYHHELAPGSQVDLALTQADDRFSFAVRQQDIVTFESCGKWQIKTRA